jgi:hypothetical protein
MGRVTMPIKLLLADDSEVVRPAQPRKTATKMRYACGDPDARSCR